MTTHYHPDDFKHLEEKHEITNVDMTGYDDLKTFHQYKNKIDELEREVELLQSNNSKWKRKYEKLKGKPTVRENRTSKATSLVQNWIDGSRALTFREIADRCFLSRETIKNISYKLRHAKTHS